MAVPAKPALCPGLGGPFNRAGADVARDSQYREFTARTKTEIVRASLGGPRTMAERCLEHDIADSLLRKWREQFRAAGLRAWTARPSAPRPTSCMARARGWSGRGGARRWRSRSRGNSCGVGSERARRPVARSRRARAEARRWWPRVARIS